MNRVEGWGMNRSFSLFLLITAGCTLKYKNENFEYFCRQIQNHGKSTKSIKINQNQPLLHALRTVGGGVANNLNDASHLPHLAEYFLILSCTSCELTEGSPRRYCTFTSSIRRAPSMTRDSANSQTCRKRGNV